MARMMPSEEATEVVKQRRTTYGHPAEVYGRWALMVEAILGCKCTTYQAGLLLAALKVAREAGIRQRDNRVDMCGYSNVLEMIDEWEVEHGREANSEAAAAGARRLGDEELPGRAAAPTPVGPDGGSGRAGARSPKRRAGHKKRKS